MSYRIKSFEDYKKTYAQSVADPEGFWADVANHFTWHKKWDKTLEWNFDEPKIEWFKNGKLNITENAIDRHLETRGNKLALIWEPNDPKERYKRFTFKDIHDRVCRLANVLKSKGIKKGDRVAIYMPMVPELAFSLLACARIGAIHNVVFAGFSAHSLADRINDSQCKAVLTSDGLYRGSKEIPCKAVVNEALKECPSVETVLVVQRTGWDVPMTEGRDFWLEEEMEKAEPHCVPEYMDAEDPLFILYTSGSTGKPKGVVHTCGGYMVYTGYTFANVFQPEESDVFWCTADIGWITGHSYNVYGPLINGTTTVMFEGIPTYPSPGRFWQVCDKYSVNQFYTAPTAIRALMAQGEDHVLAYGLYSLKLLGSVGEPINREAWEWYRIHVGKGKCPVVDTWWQTENGGIMISAMGDFMPLKPTYAGYPLPGVQPEILDPDGNVITEPHVEGYLVVKFPWPGMLRTTWGDHERCKNTYFANYKGYYFTGDAAKKDEDGMYRISGRVDDVINVSGHRFGTAEIENAINSLDEIVAESAVVGYPHDIKGQAIYAYVITNEKPDNPDQIRAQIIEAVVSDIGRIAKPEKIQFVSGLPKTRSGKIMRRILRKIAEGERDNVGDTTTLLDPDIVDEIKAGAL